MFTEIDAEIVAVEEAAAQAAEEAELEAAEGGDVEAGAAEPAEDTAAAEDTDLGTLADLESFNAGGGDLLLEDQELNIDAATILTEDDLPSPAELDSEKDFSENN
jgi:hypothetical protein